jgi:hypothetical protein
VATQEISVAPCRLTTLWQRLYARLDCWDPDWQARAGLSIARSPARAGVGWRAVTNDEAFEAFAVAMLSGNTRRDRVERVRNSLRRPFDDFRPEVFAARPEAWIEGSELPWFRERRAGGPGLGAALLRLRRTAGILAGEGQHASADAFLAAAFAEARGSPEQVAMLLGTSREWKLPGFGVALAAEGLRILGFDVCKPDRHILRAIGSWDLVAFMRWDRKRPFTAPQARAPELLATMLAVRSLAEANEVPVTYATSAIWTAGAVSGARLTNAQFAEIGRPGEPYESGLSLIHILTLPTTSRV